MATKNESSSLNELLKSVIPPWPGKGKQNDHWIGLHDGLSFDRDSRNDINFKDSFANHIRTPYLLTDLEECSFFCRPESSINEIVKNIEKSPGGGVLVTGYRGTGKTSIVRRAIEDLKRRGGSECRFHRGRIDERNYIDVNVNLSASKSSEDTLQILFSSLNRSLRPPEISRKLPRRLKRSIAEANINTLADLKRSTHYGYSISFPRLGKNDFGKSTEFTKPISHIDERVELLSSFLTELRGRGLFIIFILDELDKVESNPDITHPISNMRLDELKKVFSELRPLITSTQCHFICIAGKDVNEEFISENNQIGSLVPSVFEKHVYINSTFRSNYRATLGPHIELKGVIARQARFNAYDHVFKKPSDQDDESKRKWDEERKDFIRRHRKFISGNNDWISYYTKSSPFFENGLIYKIFRHIHENDKKIDPEENFNPAKEKPSTLKSFASLLGIYPVSLAILIALKKISPMSLRNITDSGAVHRCFRGLVRWCFNHRVLCFRSLYYGVLASIVACAIILIKWIEYQPSMAVTSGRVIPGWIFGQIETHMSNPLLFSIIVVFIAALMGAFVGLYFSFKVVFEFAHRSRSKCINEKYDDAYAYLKSIYIDSHEMLKLFLDRYEIEKQKMIDEFYEIILNSIGILKNSLSWNTGLLVTQYLARSEMHAFLWRAIIQLIRDGIPIPDWLQQVVELILLREGEDDPVCPASKRHADLYRNLLQHLTYKGRGVPRKMLSEFYSLIRDCRSAEGINELEWERLGKISYLIYIDADHTRKITFFSDITTTLEKHLHKERDDKRLVSNFYVTNYLLRYYKSGFSYSDLDFAPFNTTKHEITPGSKSRNSLISELTGVIIEQADWVGKTFRLLPWIRHDIEILVDSSSVDSIEICGSPDEYKHNILFLCKQISEHPRSSRYQESLANIYSKFENYTAQAEFAYEELITNLTHYLFKRNIELENQNRVCVSLHSDIHSLIRAYMRLGVLLEEKREYNDALVCYKYACRYLCGLNDRDFHKDSNSGFNIPLSLMAHLLPVREWGECSPNSGSQFEIPYAAMKDELHQDLYPTALNSIAITLEKLGHRLAANKSLLSAYAYLRENNREYELLDQIVFIGNLLMRRRDVFGAYLFYAHALSMVQLLKWVNCVNTDPKPQIGTDNRIARELPSQRTADLYTFLGDTVHASYLACLFNGIPPKNVSCESRCGFYVEINKQASMKANEFLKYHVEDVFLDDRIDEFFFTQAEHQYVSAGDPISAVDIYMRKLIIRSERFVKMGKLLAADVTDGIEEKKYSVIVIGRMIRAWCTFWVGLEQALDQLIDPDIGCNIATPWKKGFVRDHRLYRKCLMIAGRFLREMGEMEGSRGDFNYNALMELEWEDDDTPSRLIDKEVYRNYEEEIYEESGPCKESHRKRFSEKLYCNDSETSILDKTLDLAKAKKSIKTIFIYLNDSRLTVDFGYNTKVGEAKKRKVHEPTSPLHILTYINSPLWGVQSKEIMADMFAEWIRENRSELKAEESARRASKTKKPTSGDQVKLLIDKILEWLLKGIYRAPKDRDIAYNKLRIMSFSERILLSSYLSYSDRIRDIDTARNCYELGLLYFQSIRVMLDIIRGKGQNPKLVHLLKKGVVDLYFVSKRYIAEAIDILEEESKTNRNHRIFEARTRLVLSNLLLLRWEFLRKASGSKEDKDEVLPHNTTWSREDLKGNQNEGDMDRTDVAQQCERSLLESLKALGSEMNEYQENYPLPPTVIESHKNIVDRNMHFDISMAIRSRQVQVSDEYFMNHECEKIGDKTRENSRTSMNEISRCITQDLMVSKFMKFEDESWLNSIKRKLDSVSIFSESESLGFTIENDKIVWANQKPGSRSHPDSLSFRYCSFIDPKVRDSKVGNEGCRLFPIEQVKDAQA